MCGSCLMRVRRSCLWAWLCVWFGWGACTPPLPPHACAPLLARASFLCPQHRGTVRHLQAPVCGPVHRLHVQGAGGSRLHWLHASGRLGRWGCAAAARPQSWNMHLALRAARWPPSHVLNTHTTQQPKGPALTAHQHRTRVCAPPPSWAGEACPHWDAPAAMVQAMACCHAAQWQCSLAHPTPPHHAGCAAGHGGGEGQEEDELEGEVPVRRGLRDVQLAEDGAAAPGARPWGVGRGQGWDGDCAMCNSLKTVLQRQVRGRGVLGEGRVGTGTARCATR